MNLFKALLITPMFILVFSCSSMKIHVDTTNVVNIRYATGILVGEIKNNIMILDCKKFDNCSGSLVLFGETISNVKAYTLKCVLPLKRINNNENLYNYCKRALK
jgi:hypothetical protein